MVTNSLVFRFSIQLTIVIVILFSVLALSNVYSLEVVRGNYESYARNTLAIYKTDMHNRFNNYVKDLLEVLDNNLDQASRYPSWSEEERYFQSTQLRAALSAKMARNGASDGMFIQFGVDGLQLAQFGSRISLDEKLALIAFIGEQAFAPDSGAGVDEWSHYEVNREHYLFKYITYAGVSFGTLVQADTLMSMMGEGANDRDFYSLSFRDGALLSASGAIPETYGGLKTKEELASYYRGNYQMLTEPIPEFGAMTSLIPKRSIFFGLKSIQWLIVALAVLSVIVVPIVLRNLARDILKPVLELVKAAKEVEKGSHEFEIPPGRYSMEFTKLFHSFQSMVREITDLKIQSYEEQIERSRSEIKYLQMQIRPHFYLNAISTITSLTYQNKNSEIRGLIGYLSEHLRYMFRSGLTEVSLEEEMRHAENYIRMQEIRYPERIFYMTEIQKELGEVRIPPFAIQTFIENSFKHALFYEEMLSIFIQASEVEENGTSYAKIVIEDNGEGFPEEQLRRSGHGDSDDTARVGIVNIAKTLALLYKRDDLLWLSNREPCGAKVELWIPIRNKSQ
ncbi:sensor histidine kinase [Paenibacillus sp. CAU 1782]